MTTMRIDFYWTNNREMSLEDTGALYRQIVLAGISLFGAHLVELSENQRKVTIFFSSGALARKSLEGIQVQSEITVEQSFATLVLTRDDQLVFGKVRP